MCVGMYHISIAMWIKGLIDVQYFNIFMTYIITYSPPRWSQGNVFASRS